MSQLRVPGRERPQSGCKIQDLDVRTACTGCGTIISASGFQLIEERDGCPKGSFTMFDKDTLLRSSLPFSFVSWTCTTSSYETLHAASAIPLVHRFKWPKRQCCQVT